MRRDPVHGFMLVEVLVAVLVLALGVLGGAAMQLAALRVRHQSALLSQAVQLASSMADRMRANSGQMRLSDASNPYMGIDFDTASGAQPVAPVLLCVGAVDCGGAALARLDLFELEQQLSVNLPGGRLAICRDGSAWDAGSASLRWACDGAASAPIVIKVGWQRKDSDNGAGGALAPQVPAVALALVGPLP